MKKSLLLATALLGAASAFAAVPSVGKDASVYEAKTSGDVTFELKNEWLYSNYTTGFGAGDNKFDWATGNCRTATIYNDFVLVNDNLQGGFHKFDFKTGKYLGFVKYTMDGSSEGCEGIGFCNTITTDDFGHVIVVGYVADLHKATIKIKTLDVETGALTVVGEIDATGDTFAAASARMDYIYFIGDVTGKEAVGQAIAACASSGQDIVRGTLPQGATEWEGTFGGFYNWELRDLIATYPADMDNWGTAPIAAMIKDEEFTGDLFYIDGFTTCPSLYDVEGSAIGTFADAQSIAPKPTTNGVAEVSVAGKNFIIYSLNQYVSPEYCQARIACFGDGTEFADLEEFWSFPENGLGAQSDGGIRVHCLQSKVITDKNGKEGAYILDYKSCNGLGVYLLSEQGYDDEFGGAGVEGVEIDDNNAPAVYYNLNGVQVANPENGLYIVKRGNKVTKEVIR